MAELKTIISSATEETSPDINADRVLAWIAGSDTLETFEIASILGAALTALRTRFTEASAAGPASLQLAEDTDNGTSKVTISAPSSLAADRAWVFPDAAGTFASQSYVDTAVTGLLDAKGSTDCSANPNYPAASKGDVYVVSVAGKIGGASGITVAVGDMYWATADNAGGTQAGVGSSWDILEANLIGAMTTAGGTFTGNIAVPDDAYDATSWNSNNDVATKNAIRDKIEAVVAGAAAVSDTVYGVGWNGDTTNAPSKNAVYDKIEAVVAGSAAISDTVYGAGWNGDTTNAPSKNAVYDKIETLSSGGVSLGKTIAISQGNFLR